MIRPLILAIALSGLAIGQEPTPTPAPQPAPVVPVASIATEPTVEAGQAIILFADGSTSTGPLRWKVRPSVPLIVLDQDGRVGVVAMVKSPPAGQYRFILIATGTGNTPDVDVADVTVAEKPKPKPPAPTPEPTPTPAPPAPVPTNTVVGPGWHATLVVDPNAPAESQRAFAPLADSPTIAAAVRAMGGTWHRVAVGSAEYARTNLDPALRRTDASGPAITADLAIVVQDKAGVVKTKLALTNTATEAAVLAYLKSIVGGQ